MTVIIRIIFIFLPYCTDLESFLIADVYLACQLCVTIVYKPYVHVVIFNLFRILIYTADAYTTMSKSFSYRVLKKEKSAGFVFFLSTCVSL